MSVWRVSEMEDLIMRDNLIKLVSLNGETRGVFSGILFNSTFYKLKEDFKKPENRAVFERLKDK